MVELILPSVLLGLSVSGILISLRIEDVITALGRADSLYNRFKSGAKSMGIELNAEFILGLRMVAVVLVVLLGIVIGSTLNWFTTFSFTAAAIGIYYSPMAWLNAREKERLKDLSKEFPLMVSLLRVYSRAGGIYKALKIVKDAVQGELRRQLDILVLELEIYPLQEALDRLSDRCKYPPLTNLVSVLLMGINNGNDIDEILDKFAKGAYRVRVDEIKRKIKAQPIIQTLMPAILMFALLLIIVYPMFSNIITSLNKF
ncbi:Type II secretion system (T2SS), protein F [Desulforamulus putei DSM 12395]|uniref:Type II secretion system (T2SS), protein F n=1 Tax=Desulforamulus putei DSM 12395 TaxID=1121429 RepID=A0A1M4ZF66_9FIRM|nr:type II secretion system F family protein [Desulforamulus putei]SHF16595.1 Type II secretion system (T2SS), protein F [Desulforamulus putei DSM 12395]